MNSKIGCPYCQLPEGDPLCTHLLADWAGIGGHSDHFRHSPFLEGTLPFLTVEYDSPMILLPIDSETALGDLSTLLEAYRGNVFMPPNPVDLFQAMVSMTSVPHTRVSRGESGMAGMGGHIFFFSSDVMAAKAELDSILATLSDRIMELGQRLRDQFIKEQRHAATVQPRLEEVVYGEFNDYLVFAKRCDVDKLYACRDALSKAKTWGEFRSLIGPDAYKELIELIMWDRHRKMDFAMFFEELLKINPDADPDKAREEYLNLPIGKRLPEDSDSFDRSETPADDGDWPGRANQQSGDWVPQEIQEKYGSNEDCEFLTFAQSDERKIIAAFKRAGYRCIRDDRLIQLASSD